jgi:hypothetical protein
VLRPLKVLEQHTLMHVQPRTIGTYYYHWPINRIEGRAT